MLFKKNSTLSTLRIAGDSLAPLHEGPAPEDGGSNHKKGSSWEGVVHWMKDHWDRSSKFQQLAAHKPSDPKLLLGVLGCPLAPSSVCHDSLSLSRFCVKNVPIEMSCAQYIVQQYVAASGGLKVLSSIKSSYTRGKMRMLITGFETATQLTKNPMKAAENGWFVLWQMLPDKWHVELEIQGSSVQAGSNGKLVWRYTPWLGAHAANGPVRPLRRALQGLDPITIGNMFVNARCIGEKTIGGDDCFVLQLEADSATLSSRSEAEADVLRHVLLGYFSQRTGLLVFLEDSHLTRVETTGPEAVYWETTIESSLQDHRSVDGVTIAHVGHSVVSLVRLGEEAMTYTRTRMEEMWSIEDVAFNVPGVSADSFLPPSELRIGSRIISTQNNK